MQAKIELKRIWRVIKSRACRKAILRAFQVAYLDVASYEVIDAHNKRVGLEK